MRNHHPRTRRSIHPRAGHCPEVQPRTSLHGLHSRRAARVDTVDGLCGVPRAVPEGQEAKDGEGQPHRQVTNPGSVPAEGVGLWGEPSAAPAPGPQVCWVNAC